MGRANPGKIRGEFVGDALAVLPDTVRALGAALLLFGVCGFGIVRLALPAGLRAAEALWVLPVGAAASALALTVLGFAAVPFGVSLVVVLAAGAALSVHSWRRLGPPARPGGAVGWPGYVALMLVLVALIPFFRAGFPTVIGDGSDAHLAVGTANFLQHNYPTAINPAEPVDRVPLVWRSKHPIYYGLGAISTLSGLETYEAIAPVAALMLALAAVGLFLVARFLLGAGLLAGLVAMGVVGLDRMVLHTGMHPYFNQTWGYFAFPFALVLAWWVVRPDERRGGGRARAAETGVARPDERRVEGAAEAEVARPDERRVDGAALAAEAEVARPDGPRSGRGGAVLLALFLAIGATAYPLALPIPLTALVVAGFLERRARRRRGEEVASLSPKRLYRGPRSLLWMVPLGLLLAIPTLGVIEKGLSALNVLGPSASLRSWGGDLGTFIPLHQFFAIPFDGGAPLLIFGMLVLAWRVLRDLDRPLAWGLGAVVVLGLAFARYFKLRDYGFYFEFKTLAFVAPLVLVLAVVGLSRLRRGGPALLGLMVAFALLSGAQELKATNFQLTREAIALRGWAAALPTGASIRLDMWPPRQLWAAYFLASRPVCSQAPLLNTDYPRAPTSRKADFVVVWRGRPAPADSIGPPLRANKEYRLYRMRSDVPGPENCSREMIQRIKRITV